MDSISLKKNFTYQTVYQVLATALPLLTSPYISRVLGAEHLGIYSYTYSIANYFVMFAMLGFSNYGTRSIAYVQKDIRERDRVFCEIYSLQIITSVIMSILYFLSIFILTRENRLIAFIQSMWVISCTFDVTWFFSGLENFRVVVIRNILLKMMTLLLIFTLVKNENDLWIYTCIMAGSTLFCQGWMIFKIMGLVKCVKVSINEMFRHLKPCLLLFVPVMAVSVYHIMDKTMVGAISTYAESGYYYNADKIVNIPIGFITGIGPVMLPRMSSLVASNQIDKCKEMIEKTISLVMVSSSLMAFGIFAVSKEFIPVFFGEGFDACVGITSVLVFTIFFKAWTTVVRTQYLIPLRKEKKYIGSVVLGAVINLVLNLLLIPQYAALGAAIATLISEAVVSFSQIILIRTDVSVFKYIRKNSIYVLFGVIMIGVVRLISCINITNVMKLLLEVSIGGLVYMLLCFLYWSITKDNLYYPLLESAIKTVWKNKNYKAEL